MDISHSIDIEDLYGSSIAFVIHSVNRSLFTRLRDLYRARYSLA